MGHTNTSFAVKKGFLTGLLPVTGNGKSNSHFNRLITLYTA